MDTRRGRRVRRRLADAALEQLRAWRRGDGRAPVRLPEPEERAAHRILGFSLRAGGAMLASGAGTAEVEATILALCAACGLRGCDVDVTFTSMTASYVPDVEVEPVTAVRVVRDRSVDYRRLAALHRLAHDLVVGRISPEQAFERLAAIEAQPPRRGRLVMAGWAGMAAAFSVLLGGNGIVAATAFVATIVAYPVMGRLARFGVPDFFRAAAGAAVATGFAMILVVFDAPARTPLVVAGGIMVLVPGYALVAGVQDLLTGFPISGGARGLEVLLTAAGIVAGVALVLYLAARAGVPIDLQGRLQSSFVHLPVQVLAAGVAAALYATATSVPRRALAVAGLVGAEGWLAFLLVERVADAQIVATAVAALLVGVTGHLVAHRVGTHRFLFIVPGIMPLVPGLTIYRGMLEFFYGNNVAGMTVMLRALTVGLAIAAGVTLGHLLLEPGPAVEAGAGDGSGAGSPGAPDLAADDSAAGPRIAGGEVDRDPPPAGGG